VGAGGDEAQRPPRRQLRQQFQRGTCDPRGTVRPGSRERVEEVPVGDCLQLMQLKGIGINGSWLSHKDRREKTRIANLTRVQRC
jgi:hypothetical protein